MSESLQQIDRGIRQANIRLGRILRILEEGEPARAPADAFAEPLFDLMEAVQRSLEVIAAVPARPLPWWRRWAAASSPPPDLHGLRLGYEDVLARLRAAGIEPAPREGAVDPRMHRVVEVEPCAEPELHGAICSTLRDGWVRGGEPRRVLRTAEVKAYRHLGHPQE